MGAGKGIDRITLTLDLSVVVVSLCLSFTLAMRGFSWLPNFVWGVLWIAYMVVKKIAVSVSRNPDGKGTPHVGSW